MGTNLKSRMAALALCLPLFCSAQWELDFDESFAAASVVSANWWDGLGLTAAWPIDDGAGTNVTERVEGKTARFVGSPAWQTIGGLSALWFDGSTAYLNVGDNLDPLTNSVLVAAWVWIGRNTGSSHPQVILSKANAGATLRYTLGLNNINPLTRPYIILSDGTGTISANQNTVPPALSNWVHVAGIIYRSGFGATFTNGVFEASVSATARPGNINITDNLLIGSDSFDAVNRKFQGYIRDVAIKFNGTTNDAVSIYNATKSRYGR